MAEGHDTSLAEGGETRVTDSHASDIGHWLGMTGQKQGAGAADDCRGGRRCPPLRNCKKKNHSEGVVFLFVAAHRFCCLHSRIPQGRGSVRGKPLRVSPLAFNHPPAGDRFCAAKSPLQKRKTPTWVSFFFGAGDEARTRFPASREWHSHSQEPCLTSEFDALRAGRGSEFKPARDIPKRNTILSDGVSFWSGRRGSNSLPRPWQGRALPDELRPQTQGGLYRIFCGLSTLHFRFARKNQVQGPKALSTPSISPPRRCFQCWDRSSPSSPSCPVRPAPAPRSAAPAVPGYRWS